MNPAQWLSWRIGWYAGEAVNKWRRRPRSRRALERKWNRLLREMDK